MLILALLGCGDLSNQAFVDDASFLAALPTREDFHLEIPGSEEPPPEGAEIALLYQEVVDEMAAAGAWLEGIFVAVELAGVVHPTERRDDYRRWGPIDWDAHPGTFIDLEMSRSVTGAVYSWAFFVSRSGEGTDRTEFLWGSHNVGAEEVHAGDGTLTYDLSALGEVVRDPDLAGLVDVAYDIRDRTILEVSVDAEGDGAPEIALAYEEQEDAGGLLGLQALAQFVDGEALEEGALDAGWLSTGEGRAVVAVTGGDLGSATVEGVQCWAAQGVLVYSDPGEGDWLPAVGTPEDCALQEPSGATP